MARVISPCWSGLFAALVVAIGASRGSAAAPSGCDEPQPGSRCAGTVFVTIPPDMSRAEVIEGSTATRERLLALAHARLAADWSRASSAAI